jgi:hypothetical protein
VAKHVSKPVSQADNPLTGVSFDLDDETFECKGRVSLFEMAELIRATAGQGTTGMATIAAGLRQSLGDDEYGRLLDHFAEHRTDDDTILGLLTDIEAQVKAKVEARTGRPTKPSSDFSPGEPETDGQPARVLDLSAPGGNLRVLEPGQDLGAEVARLRGTAKTSKPRSKRAAASGG